MSSEVRLVSDAKGGNVCGTPEEGEIVIKEEMEDEASFVDLLMKPNDHQDDGGPYKIRYLAGNLVQVTIKEVKEAVVTPTSSNQHLTSTTASTTAGKSGRYQCSLCQASFPDYQTTLEHISGYGRGFKPQRCPNCRLSLCTKSELSKHQDERHHKHNLSVPDKKGSGNHVQLNIKEEVELSSAETRPLLLASKPPSCVCTNCQQAFYSKSELSQHQLEHSNCGQAPLTSESEEPFFDLDLIEAEEEVVSIKEEDDQLSSKETPPLLLASKPPSKPANLKPGPTFACTICRASFPDKATTLQHIRISHKSKGHDRQRATKSMEDEAAKSTTKANNKPLVIYWPAIKPTHQNQEVDDGGDFHSQNAKHETASGLTREREKSEAPWKRKPRSLSCPLCPRLIHRSWEMPEHLELHQSASAATCSLCGAVYRGEPQLAVHRTKVHPEEVEPPKPKKTKTTEEEEGVLRQPATPAWAIQPSIDGTFTCQFCSKAYRMKYNFTVHLRQHTRQQRPYLCSLCPAAFTGPHHLTRHEKARHPTKEQPTSYTCPSCPHRIYTTARYFRRHLRLKHPPPGTESLSRPNRHLCEECGKACLSPSQLADHRRAVHTGERPYGCSECDYRGTSKSGLTKHRKVHSRVRGNKKRARSKASKRDSHPQASSPSLSILDKTIESNSKNETEIDPKENPVEGPKAGPSPVFPCPHCPLTYAQLHHLDRHRTRKHPSSTQGAVSSTEVQPESLLTFPCAHCAHTYAKPFHLHRHLVRKHPSATQGTKEGGVPSTERKPLRRHTREQRGEKADRRTSCPQCGRIFYTKCRLAKHLKEHHEANSPWGCDVCGALYGGKNELMRHRSMVHGGGTLSKVKRRKLEMEETVEEVENGEDEIMDEDEEEMDEIAMFQDHPEVKEEFEDEEEIVFCKTIK